MSVVVPLPETRPAPPPRPGVSARRLLRFCAAIASLCALAAVPASSVFDLQSVTVLGNSAVASDDALGRAGVGPGLNAFRVNAGEIRGRLLADPRVQDVSVAMAFPRRLTITIRERPPVAALLADAGYILLGEDAVAIRESSDPGTLPVLIVDRFAPAAVEVGTTLGSPDVRLGAWIAVALPEALRPQVALVRVDRNGEASLTLGDGTVIRLGGGRRVAERLALVPEVLDAIAARKVRVQYVDLRFPGNVVIQPAAASAQGTGAAGRQENPWARGIDPAMHRPSPP
ncbi:MAG TPA: FtsQ-type POTRA domain-containing protein [bacterium]|nr:FtsQ-type POTRA domain-containing protein [bacterium]